jgi:hypothetical protein
MSIALTGAVLRCAMLSRLFAFYFCLHGLRIPTNRVTSLKLANVHFPRLACRMGRRIHWWYIGTAAEPDGREAFVEAVV